MSLETRTVLGQIQRMNLKQAKKIIGKYGPYNTHVPFNGHVEFEFMPSEPPLGMERVRLVEAVKKVLNCKEMRDG